jgi:hypothetical protein
VQSLGNGLLPANSFGKAQITLATTHAELINADLLTFIRAQTLRAAA